MLSFGKIPTVAQAKRTLELSVSTTLTRDEAMGIGLLLDLLTGSPASTMAPSNCVIFMTNGAAILSSKTMRSLRALLAALAIRHAEDDFGDAIRGWLQIWQDSE